MTELRISKNLALPAGLASQTSAVLGIRGSGKTNTAKVLVEELLKQAWQCVILDPLDAWWGLKASADGEGKGFPIAVIGGEHGDLDLTAHSGKAIAGWLVRNGASAVLSMRHLRKHEQRRVVTELLEELYHLKGTLKARTPMFVVLDEASSFVPQQIRHSEKGEGAISEARMVGAVEDLVRRGRQSGFGVCLIDQRPASVNKDVLTQLEVLIAHRITSPHDSKALKAWVDLHDVGGHGPAFLSSLPTLNVGEAWVWSPALDLFSRAQVRKAETFDSSFTPVGKPAAQPKVLAAPDLKALEAEFAATIEEAKANDPKTLKARILELEKQLAGQKPVADPAAIAAAVDQATAPLIQRIDTLETMISEARHDCEALELLAQGLRARFHFGEAAIEESYRQPKPTTAPRPVQTSAAIAEPRRPVAPSVPIDGVSNPQARILTALAQFKAIGVHSLSKGNAAVFSDQSPKSSGYRNNLSALSSKGLIRYGGEGIELTADGAKLAGKVDAPATRDDLHRAWYAKLSRPQAAMLRKLVELYPDEIHRSALATATNQSPKSSGYRNNLSKLSGLGLIRYGAGATVEATDLLFPGGLR